MPAALPVLVLCDVELNPGSAKELVFQYSDRAGNPIDLTSYGIRAMVRGCYSDLSPLVSLSVGSGITLGAPATPGTPTNYFTLLFTALQTTAIGAAVGRGVWDIFLDPNGTPDGQSVRVVKGAVLATPTATR